MASGTQDLELFVRDALLRGQTKDAIRKVLLEAGWTAEQAGTAVGAYSDVSFAVPVPRLVFDLINRAYPDPTERNMQQYLADSMRWSIAFLVIAFPVFIFLANYIGKDVARSPIRRLSPIRRWLTYLTLFVAAGALIGDLTTLAYSVLAGELTVRVTLKVLVVLVIAGAVFGYYLSDLRREERE
jgi:hypothetical protein